ncbi:MAG: BMP family ABC transporter substrate-binding protein [Clostridia bacterium]|nr:BMP family ABC transporter substrate-binding protein [Clostridia bacterium]
MVLGLTACASAEVSTADIKVGMICIGDENEGYSANHINGLVKAAESLGISKDQITFKYNIPETEAAYEAAIDLAEQGCNVIFANSFGHETYVFLAAEEYPEIEFCHATGTSAMNTGLTNTHNFFTAIYEARYVSGVVAGMKLNEMIESGKITAENARIGYVGAFPFEEVKSGYTAFFLGARSVCPSATMDVKFTNSWGDLALEKEAAEALIASGCVLISQHADTTGAPTACEAAGVPCVGYNISMIPAAPNSALTSAACNWAAYFTFALENVLAGETFAPDWCYGYVDGAVYCTELNAATVPAGAAEKVAETEAALKAGTLKVFDVNTFTVKPSANGAYTTDENGHLVSAFALDTNGDYVPDFGEAVVDGAFAESTLRSAPYFGLDIDGITMVE